MRLKPTIFNFDFNSVGVYTDKEDDPDHKGVVVDTEDMWGPYPSVGDVVSIATTDDSAPFWVNGKVYKLESKVHPRHRQIVETWFHVMLEDETHYSDEMNLTEDEAFRLKAWMVFDFFHYVGKFEVTLESFLEYHQGTEESHKSDYIARLEDLAAFLRGQESLSKAL